MNQFIVEATRLAKYGAVGIFSNVSLYLLYLGLIYIPIRPQLAVGICYILGVILSYTLNRKWTFESQSGHDQDAPKFLIAYGIGLAFTLCAITVLTYWLSAELAQILNIGLTAIVIYACLRMLRFGQEKDTHANRTQ